MGEPRSSFRASHAAARGENFGGKLCLWFPFLTFGTSQRYQHPVKVPSPRLIAIMRGALSGGHLVAWGSRSLTAWYEGVGIRGLQTATNTDLKAVLAEKIPAQQVVFGTSEALHECNRALTPPRPWRITFMLP